MKCEISDNYNIPLDQYLLFNNMAKFHSYYLSQALSFEVRSLIYNEVWLYCSSHNAVMINAHLKMYRTLTYDK